MQTSLRIPRLPVITAVFVAFVFVFFIMAGPARSDDANDPAAMKKRIADLEAKVAALEAKLEMLDVQMRYGDLNGLTPEEIGKLKKFMDAFPPDERAEAAAELRRLPAAERIQAIKQVINQDPSVAVVASKKRSQATRVLEDLRLIDSATDQYAIETNKTTGMHPAWADLKNYLKSGTTLYNTGADVFGHTYGPFTVDSIPVVSPETFNALSDVADPSFWTPYR